MTVQQNRSKQSATQGRFQILLRQLGLFGALKYLSFKAFKRLLDPSLISSYSQFGEDRIIDAYFSGQPTGFYVDIGCNHPVAYSNTMLLYQRGWHGICVDANPELIKLFKTRRPRDIAVQQVVSKQNTEVEFYFSKDSHLISGVGSKEDGNWQRTNDNSDVVLCQAITLTDLLKQHNAPQQFDLLSIDVEGHEMAVLESLDFDVYTPRLIVVEIHDFDLSRPDEQEVYRILVEQGYKLKAYARPSGFFELDR